MKTMTSSEAFKMDTEFVVDFDDTTDSHGVFGVVSGFCYSLYSDVETAEIAASVLRTQKNIPG